MHTHNYAKLALFSRARHSEPVKPTLLQKLGKPEEKDGQVVFTYVLNNGFEDVDNLMDEFGRNSLDITYVSVEIQGTKARINLPGWMYRTLCARTQDTAKTQHLSLV